MIFSDYRLSNLNFRFSSVTFTFYLLKTIIVITIIVIRNKCQVSLSCLPILTLHCHVAQPWVTVAGGMNSISPHPSW